MAFELFIGGRYLRAKKQQAFISLITILAIVGIAVGVMALIVVLSVMRGFDHDLKARILGGQAHVVIYRQDAKFQNYPVVMEQVAKVKNVEAVTPFIYTQVMLRTGSGVSGAILRGVDPETGADVVSMLEDVAFDIDSGNVHAPVVSEESGFKYPGIVLGTELARNLRAGIGDIVYVISPQGMLSPAGHMPSMKAFVLTDTFTSGLYEFDQTVAYTSLAEAQSITRMGDNVSGLELKVRDVNHADVVARDVEAKLGGGYPYWVRDWMRMNQNLFTALKLERVVMFVILTLIVLVAAFNVASSLIMMVMGKTKDIAILKAMGASGGSIRKIFVFAGMMIGVVGTVIGVILGIILCFILSRINIYELAPDIYYFTDKLQLPVRMEVTDIVVIVIAALVICFLATLYPSWQAARLKPVEAVRYA